jgi:RNA polymerase sigma-70 factor (ECF subfamily)
VEWDENYQSDADIESVRATSDANTRLVDDTLTALPDRYRAGLELRFLRGYSIKETATELGITPENAKVLQHRALARAAELLEGRV